MITEITLTLLDRTNAEQAIKIKNAAATAKDYQLRREEVLFRRKLGDRGWKI